MGEGAGMASSDRDGSRADLLAGTPYAAVRRLGRGSMGEVWEVEHLALGKLVVAKLLHKELATDPSLVDRMRIEAQAMARLDSPHLTQVTDCGQTPAGRPYYIMERLEGRTLRDELKARGAFPVDEAVRVTSQVLAALEVVHGAGLVHRDIKLDNVFYCAAKGGRGALVKLLDFGIAKVLGGGDARGPKPLARPTEEGVAMGTPRYFSPEQARGQKVDARSDLYSVGAVLYCLVAGRGPFDHHRSLVELIQAQVGEPPEAPSVHSPQALPAVLDAIVLRALEKDPQARFQSAGEMLRALEPVARASGVVVEEAPSVAPTGAAGARRWPATELLETTPRPMGPEPRTPRAPKTEPMPTDEIATLPLPAPAPRASRAHAVAAVAVGLVFALVVMVVLARLYGG